LIVVIIIKVGW